MIAQRLITVKLRLTMRQHQQLFNAPVGREMKVIVQRLCSTVYVADTVLEVLDIQHAETQNQITERRLAQSIRAEMLVQQGGTA